MLHKNDGDADGVRESTIGADAVRARTRVGGFAGVLFAGDGDAVMGGRSEPTPETHPGRSEMN